VKAKVRITKEVEVDFTHLKVKYGARYWEDASVNGICDAEGKLIPFRVGDYFCPTIEIETGKIVDWPQGTTAEIHYKGCDDGSYWLVDSEKNEYKYQGDYLPNILDVTRESYGDYLILSVNENGIIANWKVIHSHFQLFVV